MAHLLYLVSFFKETTSWHKYVKGSMAHLIPALSGGDQVCTIISSNWKAVILNKSHLIEKLQVQVQLKTQVASHLSLEFASFSLFYSRAVCEQMKME